MPSMPPTWRRCSTVCWNSSRNRPGSGTKSSSPWVKSAPFRARRTASSKSSPGLASGRTTSQRRPLLRKAPSARTSWTSCRRSHKPLKDSPGKGLDRACPSTNKSSDFPVPGAPANRMDPPFRASSATARNASIWGETTWMRDCRESPRAGSNRALRASTAPQVSDRTFTRWVSDWVPRMAIGSSCLLCPAGLPAMRV